MKIKLDRKSGISLRQQIKSAIEHAVSFGDLTPGSALPSVRELADRVGVAPMTVNKVYSDLKAEGLIEARAGAGTFVSRNFLVQSGMGAGVSALQKGIDGVIDQALAAGLRARDIQALIATRLEYRLAQGKRKSILMVGLFEGATASYAECVTAQVGEFATVEPTTLGQIEADAALRSRLSSVDLILTFANLQEAVVALMPRVPVVSIRFIPSEATRMALASIDPMARIAIVSRFADFLPVLTMGVRRFAAHVSNVVVATQDDPALPELLADCDVIVLSTGADTVARRGRPGALAIEYRHIPDPGDIDRLVVPFVTKFIAEPIGNARKEAS